MARPKGGESRGRSPAAHADGPASRNGRRPQARGAGPQGATTPAGWRSLRAIFRSVAETDPHARMAAVSRAFVGKKFIEGPTGEGPSGEVDPRPMLRLDAFDCQTLIETSMAVALTDSPAGAVECLRRIRYRDGEARYESRHADIQNDFLGNNVRLGYLRNVTERLFGTGDAESAASPSGAKRLSARRRPAKPDLPALPRTEATEGLTRRWLTYLPLSRIYAPERSGAVPGALERGGYFINLPLLERIPSGTVCALVRGRIIHVGIVVQTPEGSRLRHAVRAAAVVREEKMVEYLFMLSRLGLCQGIMLFEVGSPAADGQPGKGDL